MLMPASSAAWIVAMLSSRSAAPYEPDIDMAPRLRAETAGPVAPRFLVCMVVLPASKCGPADVVVVTASGGVAAFVIDHAAPRGRQPASALRRSDAPWLGTGRRQPGAGTIG